MNSANPIRAGVDVTATDDIDIHRLGTEVMRGSTKYVYVRSAAALTQYYAYAIEDSFTVGAATKTSTIGNSPRLVGVPQITIATPTTGYTYRYFWVAVKGDMEVLRSERMQQRNQAVHPHRRRPAYAHCGRKLSSEHQAYGVGNIFDFVQRVCSEGSSGRLIHSGRARSGPVHPFFGGQMEIQIRDVTAEYDLGLGNTGGLGVEFFYKAEQQGAASNAAGHPVFEQVEYVRIRFPGGKDVFRSSGSGTSRARQKLRPAIRSALQAL